MLLSLQSSLHTDIYSSIHKFTSKTQSVGEKVNYIKHSMEECTTTINDLVDAYDDSKDNHLWIKTKLADLEERSCHKNIKLRGVPETVQANDLQRYAHKMLSALMPDVPPVSLHP